MCVCIADMYVCDLRVILMYMCEGCGSECVSDYC